MTILLLLSCYALVLQSGGRNSRFLHVRHLFAATPFRPQGPTVAPKRPTPRLPTQASTFNFSFNFNITTTHYPRKIAQYNLHPFTFFHLIIHSTFIPSWVSLELSHQPTGLIQFPHVKCGGEESC